MSSTRVLRHWVGFTKLEREQTAIVELSNGPSAKDNFNWRWDSEDLRTDKPFSIHRMELMSNARNQVYPLDWGFSFVSGFFPVGHQSRQRGSDDPISSVYMPSLTSCRLTVFVPGDFERLTMDEKPLRFSIKYYYLTA